MKGEDLIKAADLPTLLSVNFRTTELWWRPVEGKPAWNAQHGGRRAFYVINKTGYRVGQMRRKQFLAHRVLWALFHGEWPDGMLDHINGDRLDNRICNLRLATPTVNSRNRVAPPRSNGLPVGVRYNARQTINPYTAEIKVSGRRIYIGAFATPEEAHHAYLASRGLYGFSSRHGSQYHG